MQGAECPAGELWQFLSVQLQKVWDPLAKAGDIQAACVGGALE